MVNEITSNPGNLHGFRIKIYPTEEQKERIKEISNLFRFIFNWSLSEVIFDYLSLTQGQYDELRKNGMSHQEIYFAYKPSKGRKIPSFVTLTNKLTSFRNENEWLKKIPVNIARYAIKNMYYGYQKFFKRQNCHPPRFQKKSNKQVFSCRGERVRFKGEYVKIEGIETPILYKKTSLIITNKLYNCTISFDGVDYWLSGQTEIIYPITFESLEGPIGIDVGMRKLATLSDGTFYKLPNTKHLEKRLSRKQARIGKDRRRRLNQSIEAKTKLEDIPISKRMQKRYREYRKLSSHIWNIRKTFVHTMTREIVNRRPSTIVIENIKVEDLIEQNDGKFYQYLFGEIRRQIEYKARWANIPIIVADSYYPSSQICSGCGHKQKIGRSETYRCPNCGLVIDRDLNAALNLRSLAT